MPGKYIYPRSGEIISPWTEKRMFAAVSKAYGPQKHVTSVCARNVPAYQKERELKRWGSNETYWLEKRRYIDALIMKNPSAPKLWAVEIKVSLSDLKVELKDPEKTATWHAHTHAFYFAVPPKLEEAALDLIPKKYGILKVMREGSPGWEHTEVLRRSKVNKSPLPLDLRTYFALARRAGRQDFAECMDSLVIS